MTETIAERLKRVFTGTLNLPATIEEIENVTDLKALGINSMNFMKLIVAIEKEFDMEFDDLDLDFDNFKTFDDFTEYISQKVS